MQSVKCLLAYLSGTNNPCSSWKTEIRSLSNTLTAASIQIPISTKKNTDVNSRHALKLVCKHSDVNMIQIDAGIHRQTPVRYIWCLLAFEVSLIIWDQNTLSLRKCDTLGRLQTWGQCECPKGEKNRYNIFLMWFASWISTYFFRTNFHLPSLCSFSPRRYHVGFLFISLFLVINYSTCS